MLDLNVFLPVPTGPSPLSSDRPQHLSIISSHHCSNHSSLPAPLSTSPLPPASSAITSQKYIPYSFFWRGKGEYFPRKIFYALMILLIPSEQHEPVGFYTLKLLKIKRSFTVPAREHEICLKWSSVYLSWCSIVMFVISSQIALWQIALHTTLIPDCC